MMAQTTFCLTLSFPKDLATKSLLRVRAILRPVGGRLLAASSYLSLLAMPTPGLCF